MGDGLFQPSHYGFQRVDLGLLKAIDMIYIMMIINAITPTTCHTQSICHPNTVGNDSADIIGSPVAVSYPYTPKVNNDGNNTNNNSDNAIAPDSSVCIFLMPMLFYPRTLIGCRMPQSP